MDAFYHRDKSTDSPKNDRLSQVLVLADDGRMERLFGQTSLSRTVQADYLPGVLQGIVQLSRCEYDYVLLNAEVLEKQTPQVVQALRKVKNTPVVLYGQAYAEVFASSAIRAGASDYLVWPIPVAELKSLLNGRTKENPPTQNQKKKPPVKQKTIDQIALYHRLVDSVTKGQVVLVKQARQILPELLGVEWVDFQISSSQGLRQEALSDRIVTMNDQKLGEVGSLILGPPATTRPVIAPAQAADYMALLLALTRRETVLKKLAMTDDLTGVYNRRYLEHFLKGVIQRYAGTDTEMSLLVFDVDDFKYYNDTYGHKAGDEILQQAVSLAGRSCRRHDLVARIGGDEFAVLFWECDTPNGRSQKQPPQSVSSGRRRGEQPHRTMSQTTRAEWVSFMSNRFRRLMMTNDFPGLGPQARRGVLTISGGMADFPRDAATVQELFVHADMALLEAKRKGKNRIFSYREIAGSG